MPRGCREPIGHDERHPSMKKILTTLVVLLVACSSSAPSFSVTKQWARTSPMDSTMGAAYFMVTSPTADTLIGVKVDPSVAAMAQMHETVMDNGAMNMQEVNSVDLPAGSAVEFTPGGYHVMFMDLKTPLQQGRSVKGTLVFEKAGTVEVEYAVEAMGGSAPAHRGH